MGHDQLMPVGSLMDLARKLAQRSISQLQANSWKYIRCGASKILEIVCYEKICAPGKSSCKHTAIFGVFQRRVRRAAKHQEWFKLFGAGFDQINEITNCCFRNFLRYANILQHVLISLQHGIRDNELKTLAKQGTRPHECRHTLLPVDKNSLAGGGGAILEPDIGIAPGNEIADWVPTVERVKQVPYLFGFPDERALYLRDGDLVRLDPREQCLDRMRCNGIALG